jgi:hypothetical protein
VNRRHPPQNDDRGITGIYKKMDAEASSLKTELVETALSMGAVDARVAIRQMMEGPPLADPEYVLSGATGGLQALFFDILFRRDT